MELCLGMGLKVWNDPKYPKIKVMELFPPPLAWVRELVMLPNIPFPVFFPESPLAWGRFFLSHIHFCSIFRFAAGVVAPPPAPGLSG